MASSYSCARCLRVSRLSSFAQPCVRLVSRFGRTSATDPIVQHGKSFSSQTSLVRTISSTTLRRQSNVQPSNPEPHTRPPPFTTGTVTSNVTAAPPSSNTTNVSSHPEPSTTQMQKQIAASLGATRGSSLTENLAKTLRKTAKSATESYITYGVTEAFFKSCAAQAPYSIPEEQRTRILTDQGPPKTVEGEDLGVAEADTWWFRELGLPPTFSTWSQVCYLHMYLLTVRLRALDDATAFTSNQRYLIEHFSHAAEDKMLLLHTINARGIRNKYLKDLFLQWRGLLAAYDEGLVKGDAVLAGAVWRNLWKGSEDVDWEKVAAVVAYMRKAVQQLGDVEADQLVHNLDGGQRVWERARTNTADLIQRMTRANTH